MATILENGDIKFGDGTTTSTAIVTYSSVANRKTTLSQFTNDLGNYGKFISPTNVQQNVETAQLGNIALYLYYNTTTSQIQLLTNDCNCACNC